MDFGLNRMRLLCAVALCGFALAGCNPVATLGTAAGTTYATEMKQRQIYQQKVRKLVEEYAREHQDSPCQNGEDRVIQAGVEVLENDRYYGFEEVTERLETIYRDESNSSEVRAGALYYTAVLYTRSPYNSNKVLATNYFLKLYTEFPNQYRCIFEESEWRDKMIRKHLLLPGETMAEFKARMESQLQGRAPVPQ